MGSTLIICSFCQNQFPKKELVSSKKHRYGKKKCCKECHESNLEARDNLLYHTYVVTADYFYPNYDGDQVAVMVTRNYPWYRIPEPGEDFCLKISVWGADDDYLVKYFKFTGKDNYQDRVHDVIQIAKRIPVPITRICLRLMGFYYD